jgi:hypothetical protein
MNSQYPGCFFISPFNIPKNSLTLNGISEILEGFEDNFV